MKTVTTTIDVDAGPEHVWATLTDFDAYPEWNPFVTAIDGTVAEGERLSVRIEPPEGRGMGFTPRVTAAVPGERLEWLGKLGVRGLFDGRHEFRLEALDDGRTRLHHGESFSGLLVGLLLDEGDIQSGFEAMNETLKARVESGVTSPVGAGDDADRAAA
ncbi:SRPBCC domain-containing protein [Halomicroarcula sp. F13]|uniref:SRPBCC domain-containing protein n=1 Tax=Haloarcula rubra TaxID=2487747 RepID=A0AAW4PSV4_9EURY|nr:SRPBCC domain-containing protein [Halomicroarcula rubra]MBX0323645.1 SRPBCC domain-containing protein [Halomicroarcula rubra]